MMPTPYHTASERNSTGSPKRLRDGEDQRYNGIALLRVAGKESIQRLCLHKQRRLSQTHAKDFPAVLAAREFYNRRRIGCTLLGSVHAEPAVCRGVVERPGCVTARQFALSSDDP